MSCRPIYQDIREVGKTIKSSKKLFIWKFNIDGKDYTIELYNSLLSGKKKITQNGQIIYENNSYQGVFLFPFSIGRNSLSIVQHGDKFELRVNNQSFQHLYDQKMQNQHFKTDDREDRDSRDQRERSPREQRVRKKPRENKAPAGLDEDEEIRIAIELSKQTAKKEEKDRMKEAKVASKTNIRENNQKEEGKGGGDEFDFGDGFQKFSTTKKNDNIGGDDINNFDFGDGEKSKPKQGDDFEFNFAGGANNAPKQEEKPAQSNDLMDLLGGIDMSGGATQNTNQNSNAGGNDGNALDFFNSGGNDAFGGGQQQNQAQQNNQNNGGMFNFDAGDPFSPQQTPQPGQQQQEQPAQPEKPKFQPNLNFLTGMQGNQQQNMYGGSQQMGYATQQNGYGMQQQNQYGQFGTQQQPMGGQMGGGMMGNPMGGGAGNPFGGQQDQFNNQFQQQNQFQTQNNFGQQNQFGQQPMGSGMGGGMMGNQIGTNQQSNPFDQQNNNMGGFQTQQQPPQQQEQFGSTPFDMF